MIAPTSSIDSILQTGGTASSPTLPFRGYVKDDSSLVGTSVILTDPLDIVPKYKTLPIENAYADYKPNIIPPPVDNTGASTVSPSPIDTVPSTASTPTNNTGASTVSPSPIDVVPPKTDSSATVTVSGVPLVGSGITGILGSLGNMFGGGGNSEESAIISKKENSTYWLYVAGGALILGYFLVGNKK